MSVIINGTTGISGVDGSAATPALQGADSNTGISFGTDTVTINTGGVARVTTDSSGNLLVGTTSATGLGSFGSGFVGIGVSQANFMQISRNSSGTKLIVQDTVSRSSTLVSFGSAGTEVGAISTNGTGVTYGSASDYRLKESIAPMTGALAKNELLNPVTYKWKLNGSDGQGFIAHELQAIFPDAVTGEKDGVDDEGNPKYQGVDTSFLVGHLVACVKELKAELDSVKAELATLKGAA